MNAIDFRIFPHKTHGAGQIQRPFLLCIRPQAVVYHKALIPQFTEGLGHRRSLVLIAAKLEGPSGADQYRALYRCPFRHREGNQIGPKVRIIEIVPIILGIFRDGGNISFFPEVQCLRVLGVGGGCRHRVSAALNRRRFYRHRGRGGTGAQHCRQRQYPCT